MEQVGLAALEVAGGTLELVPLLFHEDVEEPYRLALDARACPGCGSIALRTTEFDYAETLAEVLGTPCQALCPGCGDAPHLEMELQDSPFLVRGGQRAGALRAIACRGCGQTRLRRAAQRPVAGAAGTDRAWCACVTPALGPFTVAIRALYGVGVTDHRVKQEHLVVSWQGDDAGEVRACCCPACNAVALHAPRKTP